MTRLFGDTADTASSTITNHLTLHCIRVTQHTRFTLNCTCVTQHTRFTLNCTRVTQHACFTLLIEHTHFTPHTRDAARAFYITHHTSDPARAFYNTRSNFSDTAVANGSISPETARYVLRNIAVLTYTAHALHSIHALHRIAHAFYLRVLRFVHAFETTTAHAFCPRVL